MANYDAIIVGAGAAGLVAAKELEAFKLRTLIVDAAPEVGGRLQSDQHNGYILDHGFQVLLSAYPMVKKHLDLKALKVKSFKSGALLFNDGQRIKVQDVNRQPSALLSMAFSGVGSIFDKLKMAKLRKEVLAETVEEIFERKDQSTAAFLKEYGFSKKIIQRFFQPFFGGIFLESRLETSARQFLFVFKMFAEGDAVLPEGGINAVAQQLKQGLKSTDFRLNTKVLKVSEGKVHLEEDESLEAPQIIIATDPQKVMPQLEGTLSWNKTLQVYFEGPAGAFNSRFIALNFKSEGLVNNVACLSAVQSSYAPKGKHLYSVSLKKDPGLSETDLQAKILSELHGLLGSSASAWKMTRSYKVSKALPRIDQVVYERAFEESRVMDGIYIAGDFLLNPSLNAAMLSGESAAKALILNHKGS